MGNILKFILIYKLTLFNHLLIITNMIYQILRKKEFYLHSIDPALGFPFFVQSPDTAAWFISIDYAEIYIKEHNLVDITIVNYNSIDKTILS